MQTFDIHNGLIAFYDFQKNRESMNILKDCIAIPTGGEIHNGKNYVPIFLLETVDEVKKALEIIATIYGIEIENSKNHNKCNGSWTKEHLEHGEYRYKCSRCNIKCVSRKFSKSTMLFLW